jgi:hypothetical protein
MLIAGGMCGRLLFLVLFHPSHLSRARLSVIADAAEVWNMTHRRFFFERFMIIRHVNVFSEGGVRVWVHCHPSGNVSQRFDLASDFSERDRR